MGRRQKKTVLERLLLKIMFFNWILKGKVIVLVCF